MPGLPVSWNSKLFRTSQLRERASPWFVLCFTVRWLPGGTSCRRMQDTLFVDVTTNICSSHWITCRTVLVFSLSFFFFFLAHLFHLGLYVEESIYSTSHLTCTSIFIFLNITPLCVVLSDCFSHRTAHGGCCMPLLNVAGCVWAAFLLSGTEWEHL